MDARKEQGVEIAATAGLVKKGGVWLVPSRTQPAVTYTVCPDKYEPHCTCPDHELNGGWCKHIWAVEFARTDLINKHGHKPEPVIPAAGKKTYSQDWKAYNAAQTHEKELFLQLLRELCDGIVDYKPAASTGRPRYPLQDAIFCACYKVYSTVSRRRFMTDLRETAGKGMISRAPHFNTISNTLEDPDMAHVLLGMITESSLPLKAVEVDFAVDSSGFSTSRFVRWFDHKYGTVRQQHEWVKVHLMCGVKTNIVTAVEIREKDANDTRFLRPLVNKTARNFQNPRSLRR